MALLTSERRSDPRPWWSVAELTNMGPMVLHRTADPSCAEQPLELNDCWALLRNEAYGRLAVIGEDGPDIFPINARVDHGTVVFRTATGSKLSAIHEEPRVAFEVDGYDDVRGTAWSVVIRGTANEVTDQYEGLEVVELGVTPWQRGLKPVFVRIVPTTVSGRRFERTRIDPSTPDAQRTTSVD